MNKVNITETEKKHILNLHLISKLNETTEITNKPVDYKLMDIQTLVGLTGRQADNVLGPITYKLIDQAITKKLEQKSKEVVPELPKTGEVLKVKKDSEPIKKSTEQPKIDTTMRVSSSYSTKSDTERLKNIGVDSSGRVTDKFGTKPLGF